MPHLTDLHPEFIHPDDKPPPLGTKLILYTRGHIATLGHWGADCLLYAALPDVSMEMKLRLEREELGSKNETAYR